MTKTCFIPGWGFKSDLFKAPILNIPKTDRIFFDFPTLPPNNKINYLKDSFVTFIQNEQPETIIAWSFGSFLSLDYTIHNQNHTIKKIIAIAPLIQLLKTPDFHYGFSDIMYNQLKEKIQNMFDEGIKQFQSLLFYTKNEEKIKEWNKHLKTYTDPDEKKVTDYLNILTEINIINSLSKINTQIKIIHGRQDKVQSYKAIKRAIKLLPDAELFTLEQCGHVPFLEQKEKCTAIVEKLL
ncbi:alpha/beta hydrolase [Candidatus Margulisiibacteriota bacterium]